MTVAEIQKELARLEARMAERGFITPECHVRVRSSRINGTARAATRRGEGLFSRDGFECYVADDTPAGVLAKLFEAIEAATAPDDMRKKALLRNLSDVIAEAKALDLPVDFQNPLIASMKALSENAITDQSK